MGWYHTADWEDFQKEAKAEQEAEAAAAAAAANRSAPPKKQQPKSSGNTACPLPATESPPPPPPDVESIYHLCQKANWDAAYYKREPYFPPTFVQDGKFTRATVYKEDLVKTANEYYRNTPGEWICLELDAKVLYGLGIPIFAQQAPESTVKEPVKCLQVFGGITTTMPGLLKKVYPMKRSSNGKFLQVMDPPDCGCGTKVESNSSNTQKPKSAGIAKPEQAKGKSEKKSGMSSWFKMKSKPSAASKPL